MLYSHFLEDAEGMFVMRSKWGRGQLSCWGAGPPRPNNWPGVMIMGTGAFLAAVVLLAVLKGGGARVDYCIIGAGPSGREGGRVEIYSHCTYPSLLFQFYHTPWIILNKHNRYSVGMLVPYKLTSGALQMISKYCDI